MSTQGRAQFTPGPWRVINDKTIVGADYPRQGYVADVNLHRNSDAQEVDGQANATLIAAAPAMYEALQNLLEWAKGNRGAREGNPYCKPEVRQALKVLASIQDKKDYIDADTAPQAEGRQV